MVSRATSKENRKPRPPFYSKRDCLYSLLRTWDACSAAGEIVFVNDGRLLPERLVPMEATGAVVAHDDLDMRQSYLRALEQVDERGWADEDLVFFVEDDYLHRPQALSEVVAAARALADVQYFGTYGIAVGGALQPDMRRPRVEPEPARVVGDVRWQRGLATTFTYAVRVSALRRDRLLHRATPSLGGAFDYVLGLTYQGLLPYRPRDIAVLLREDHTWSRRAKLLVWRVGATAASQVRRRRPHRLAIADPALSSHMEVGFIADGIDWAAEARDAVAWARQRGLEA